MTRLVYLLTIITLAAPTAVLAQATGKAAMHIVARDRGADYMPRMLHLFAENGIPQPQVWRVIARDRQNAVREFYVSKGTIVSEGIIPPAKANGISGTPLPVQRLAIDSDAAFAKAEKAARSAKVGFDRLFYQLRCLELSNNAAWFIVLVDAQGAKVGEVSVGASTGSVLTQSWYPRGTAVAPTPAIVMPTVPKTPGFWERARQSFTQSGRNIRHGVGNAAGWVQQKVTP